MKLIEMKGLRFGRLVVLDKDLTPRMWKCLCDCGKTTLTTGANLRKGSVRSCGCLMREWSKFLGSNPEFVAKRSVPKKHGEASRRAGRTVEYKLWRGMRDRCNRPGHKDYKNWGGRGISVCERWDDFANFLSDMGRRPSPDHSIDRIAPDGNYSPENCRWATSFEQTSEHRRNLTPVTVNGTPYPSLKAACRGEGVPHSRTHMRLVAGMTIERAFHKGRLSRWQKDE